MRLFVTLVWLSSVVATAQPVLPRSPASVPQRPDRVQQVTFGGTEVTGGIVKGEMGCEIFKPNIIFKNLIQLRGSFAKELHDSVDAL